MKLVLAMVFFVLSAAAQAQTIEGFWQDSARRILFDRSAPPSYKYGTWDKLDLGQTYPSVKQIRRQSDAYDLVELLYEDTEVSVKVVGADAKSIRFIRTAVFPACAMHHSCRLEGEQLFCALENFCRVDGREVLDWRGEERYLRRASCERDGKRQAQGIPVKCR